MTTPVWMVVLALAVAAPLFGQNGPFATAARATIRQSGPSPQVGDLVSIDVWIDLSGVVGECAAEPVAAGLGAYLTRVDFDPQFLQFEYALRCPNGPDSYSGPLFSTNPWLANEYGWVKTTQASSERDPATRTNACYTRLVFRALAQPGQTSVRGDCGPEGFNLASDSLVEANCGPHTIPVECGPPIAVTIGSGACQSDVSPPLVTAPPPLQVAAMDCGAGRVGAPVVSLGSWLLSSTATDACATLMRLPPLVDGVVLAEDAVVPVGIAQVDFRWVDGGGNVGSARSTLEVTMFYGDLNEDGRIGAADLLALARHVEGGASANGSRFAAAADAADLDLDLDADQVDLSILGWKLVGMIDCVPVH